jgi:probable DNA metabolism protein
LTLIYTYDGTFEGFLTSIFECYNRKDFPVEIVSRNGEQKHLFAQKMDIQTDETKAERVWKGIQQKMTEKNKQLVFYAFLSEEHGVEMKIYRFLRRLFSGNLNIETDFGDPDVLYLTQTSRKVKQEAMRMLQFVRFQHTKDGLYFCGIEPRYDVIPLVVSQFQKRFADQRWLLYDLKRNYGILYDKNKPQEVVISNKEFSSITGQVNENVLQEGEEFYQKLWKSYFTHINIQERKNLKLQRQHLPRRFWKYLTEMQQDE